MLYIWIISLIFYRRRQVADEFGVAEPELYDGAYVGRHGEWIAFCLFLLISELITTSPGFNPFNTST